MDNPVDNIVDLGLVNYVKHPENPNYIVFRFADAGRANSFETELNNLKIWFEKSEDQGKYILFGIHKNDFKKVEGINYKVEAKHKKPFIPFAALRYGLILFSTIVMILAIMGYCESRKVLNEVNEVHRTIN